MFINTFSRAPGAYFIALLISTQAVFWNLFGFLLAVVCFAVCHHTTYVYRFIVQSSMCIPEVQSLVYFSRFCQFGVRPPKVRIQDLGL